MKTTLSNDQPMELSVANFFPDDLGEWMTRPALLGLVRDTAHEFAWGPSDDTDCVSLAEDESSQKLLTLLTWCCATGRHATTEIPECVDGHPALSAMLTGSCAGARTIRLFRSQNRELLKHCLARVLELAWLARQNAVNGFQLAGTVVFYDHTCSWQSMGFRKLCHAEAETRLLRAIAADLRPLSMPAPSSTSVATSARNFSTVIKPMPGLYRRLMAATCLVLCAFLPWLSQAEDRCASVTVDWKIYKNVRVCKVTPVELVLRLENGGALTLKRQELPEELVAKYPYDPEQAAAFEKRQADERRARDEQARADARKSLERQEQLVKTRVAGLQDDLVELQKEMVVLAAKARGRRPNSTTLGTRSSTCSVRFRYRTPNFKAMRAAIHQYP